MNGRPLEYDAPLKLEGPRRIGLRGMSGGVRVRNLKIQGRLAPPDDSDGHAPLLLGSMIYADDLSDPATESSREDISTGAGQEPFKRNYEGGLYYLQAPPNRTGISAWNAWGALSADFEFEAVGRVVGADPASPGGWMLIIAGPGGRAFQVSIDRAGRFAVEPAFWAEEKYPNDPKVGP